MHSDLPKVLQPLAGRPLLAHVLGTARELEPACIYVVYGHGGAAVQAALQYAAVDWVLQSEQLGTGHAVMQALPMIPDDHLVLVLYGDVPLVRPTALRQLLTAAGSDSMAVLTAEVAEPQGYGRILRAADGGISAIVEEKDATLEQRRVREINSGLMVMPAARLRGWLSALSSRNAQGEFLLTDIVAGAVADGLRVTAVVASPAEQILGVNDKLQLAALEALHRRERALDLLQRGATLADPLRIDVRGSVELGRDVFIDVNAVLVGSVKLGARVTIGPNCVIRDSVIGADTEIQANSVVDHALVGEHCRIGPFARLRPDTRIAPHGHIGNFVEVKNSRVGAHSKINHLTYIGDAEIGADVNVGAGSVTCNYDGQNKWPTIIEDGAFIGSGSMLVAPVKIGAHATIGAGSTITSNAPEQQLTLTRPEQVSVDGWRRATRLDELERAAIAERKLRDPPQS
jgi:bifunctional UDP-N-acetylglucosamine pyrophosphorylase/glucosamine-1-phosphate N-acetyltransferase